MVKHCNNMSVGLLPIVDRNVLLIERLNNPLGWACPAGHVEDAKDFDDEEAFRRAGVRELDEEVSLIAHPDNLSLVLEGRFELACSRLGGDWHYWRAYVVKDFEGEPCIPPEEQHKIGRWGWFSEKEIYRLAERTRCLQVGEISKDEWEGLVGLEEMWRLIFQRLSMV